MIIESTNYSQCTRHLTLYTFGSFLWHGSFKRINKIEYTIHFVTIILICSHMFCKQNFAEFSYLFSKIHLLNNFSLKVKQHYTIPLDRIGLDYWSIVSPDYQLAKYQFAVVAGERRYWFLHLHLQVEKKAARIGALARILRHQ